VGSNVPVAQATMQEVVLPECMQQAATPTYPASRSRSNANSTFTSPTPPRRKRRPSQSLCNDHIGTVITEIGDVGRTWTARAKHRARLRLDR
jgi:hypothetical protein